MLCGVVGTGPNKIASHRRDVDNANDYDDDFNLDMMQYCRESHVDNDDDQDKLTMKRR